jgi:hypothetical protein
VNYEETLSGRVVGIAKVDGTAELGVHGGAADSS